VKASRAPDNLKRIVEDLCYQWSECKAKISTSRMKLYDIQESLAYAVQKQQQIERAIDLLVASEGSS
jgi:hypothetical protein